MSFWNKQPSSRPARYQVLAYGGNATPATAPRFICQPPGPSVMM